MTSLATCLRRAGKAIDRADAEAVREIVAEGIGAEAAIEEYLGVLEAERGNLAAEIEEQGGIVPPRGVEPEEGDLQMSEIDFDDSLSEGDYEHQQAFAEWATTTPWPEIRAAYMAMDGSETAENVEGGRILSVDAARELYPPYRTNRGLSNATHEVASAIIKKLYRERLRLPSSPGERWMWTAGGTGAGKTSGLKLSGHARNADLVYDGNLAKFNSARMKIDAALDTGRMVAINYVFRDPMEAWQNGVVKRTLSQIRKIGSGRTLTPRTHAFTHAGSREVVQQLRDHYADDPRVVVEVIDNSNGRGNAVRSKLNNIKTLNEAAIRKAVTQRLEELHDRGIIPTPTYAQFLGRGAEETPAAERARRASARGQYQPRSYLYSRSRREARDEAIRERERRQPAVGDNPEGRPAAPPGEPAAPIPTNLSQEEKADLQLELAQENKALLDPILETIATRLGVRLESNIKAKHKVIEKANRPVFLDPQMKNRPWWNVEHVRDVFRFRGWLNDLREAEQIMTMMNDMLQPQGGLVVVKADVDKYATPTEWGWRPLAFDIRMPNGQIAEFYMAPKEMIALSEGENHTIYERWRELDPFEMTTRQLRRYEKDRAKSYENYEDAYQHYLDRNHISPMLDAASARNLAALAESFTRTNELSRSATVSRPGGLEDQTPSEDLNALRSSSSMTTIPSSETRTDIDQLYARGGGTQPVVQQAQLQLALAPTVRALAGTVNVNIAQTTEELPGEAVPTDVEGMWRIGTNEVWLVASNLPSVERAKQVMAHEAFGHLAMEETPEFHDVLASVKNLLAMGNKTFKEVAAQVALRQGALDETTQAKEILAYMVENDMENGTIARALAAVRTKLRQWGLLDGANYSEAEIKALLVRAARDLMAGAEAKQKALAAMPEQERILSDPRAVEGVIMAAVREVYANQTLQDTTMELLAELETATPERAAEINQILYRQRIAPTLTADVIHPDALYQIAYHGSDRPRFDRFSLKYVGSADNGLVNGWGGYFTSRDDLANWYVTSRGSLIEADIPEDNEMLDWSKTIDQQPTAVRDVVRKRFPELWQEAWIDSENGEILEDSYVKSFPDNPAELGFIRAVPAEYLSGENFYYGFMREQAPVHSQYAQTMDLDKAVSVFLRDELGVPGHRMPWPDGSGEVNYVIYDDTRIDIVNQTRAKTDFEMSADYSLFSRAGTNYRNILRLTPEDMGGQPQPSRVAYDRLQEMASGQTASFYFGLSGAASNEGAKFPVGSWQRRYYSAMSQTAINAARSVRQGTPFGEPEQPLVPGRTMPTDQMALFSRARVLGSPEIEAIRARVMAPALEDIGVKDRVREAVQRILGIDWLSVKQGIIDSAAAVESLEKGIFGRLLDANESAYKGMLSTRNLGSVMAAIMHRGIPIYQNGVFTARAGRKGLIEIFEPITQHKDGNLLPLWELYAAAVRASRLIKEKNPDGSIKEKMFTPEEINRALALGEQYPVFKQAHQEWQKFNSQLLDLAIKQGVINGEEAKIWRRNDYVPFYRAMEEVEYQGGQGPQTGGTQGIANVRAGIRRLTGEEKPIGNVFENMVMNTAYLIDAVYRNTAMQRVVAMADMIAMEKVPMATEVVKFRAGDLARALMNAGLIVGQGQTETDMLNDAIRQVRAMSKEQREQWIKLFRRVAPVGNDIVSVLQDGKPVYYRVLDPLLLRSIGAMGAQQWGGIMNTFRFAKRTLTKAVTIDPAFMMANFIRDTLSTAVITKGSATKQITGAIKGLKAAWNEDEDMLALMMAGAGGGGFYDHNPQDVRKMLAKKMPKGQVNSFMNSVLTPRGLWRFWQKVGNAAEQGNRVSMYRNTLASGGSVAEAAYQARDVLNFTMAGDYNAMKFLVQTVPFLNARIQGLYRLYRGGRENPVGFAMKGLGVIAATLALLARNSEDERYRELPEWDKDIYWHFFIGDEHFRLPKPFEVGALFATVPERMANLASGDDDMKVFQQSINRMMLDTFAFNPMPQLVKPTAEVFFNRNLFTGNPIIGLMHEGLEPEAQYDPWTSETMRELAKIMPTDKLSSPKNLQHLVRAHFGTVGMYSLMAADAVTRRAFGHAERPTKGLHNWPVVTRFWRDPNPRTSKYSAQMYDMLSEADSLYRTMNAYRQQGRIEEAREIMDEDRGKLAARAYLHDVSAAVRKVNQKIRLIQYSDMDPDDKKARIDELNRKKLDLMAKVAKVSDVF